MCMVTELALSAAFGFIPKNSGQLPTHSSYHLWIQGNPCLLYALKEIQVLTTLIKEAKFHTVLSKNPSPHYVLKEIQVPAGFSR